ncbi:MAG: SLC13 family permease [Deltaproteobacteria bacterium]|nr:SLC13 family permease [Deltaproteobacteria bacterium]
MRNSTLTPHRLVASAACAAGVALAVAPTPTGLPAEILPAAAVAVVCIGLWATAVIPEYLTAVIFCFLAVTVAAAPPDVVFAGFQSTAAWLVFGGLIIAASVQTTGLGARIATAAVGYFGRSYRGFLWRIVLTAALMGFIMPSNMGRVLVMLPIFLNLGERLGFGPGSKGRTGVTLAVAAGSIFPSFGILTAAVPNVVLLGAAESIHGIEITYGEFFLLHFPVISIVNIVALPFLIAALFPARLEPASAPAPSAPWTAAERNLVLILVVTLALWVTDHWHRVSPAWIALGAGILCLLPRLGCIPATSLTGKVNLGPWLFICGIIGMGSVVVHSGLGGLLAGWLLDRLPMQPGHDLSNLAAMSAVGMIISMATTVPGEPVIAATLARDISAASGWPVATVLLVQAVNWSMVPFPYELPPMVVASRMAGMGIGHATRLLLALTLLAWLVTLPLHFVWLRHLGYFAG